VLVWWEGQDNWIPARRVKGLFDDTDQSVTDWPRDYFLLGLYSGVYRIVGVIGLVAAIVAWGLGVFVETGFLFRGIVVALSSLACLAFAEAIVAFIDLVRNARQTNVLLTRIAHGVEGQQHGKG